MLLLPLFLLSPRNAAALNLDLIEVQTYYQGQSICDVIMDERGIMWVAVKNLGLYRFEPGDSESTATVFTKELNGLPGLPARPDLWDMESDPENRLWIAIWGKGLSIVDDGGTAVQDDDIWGRFTSTGDLPHDELPALDIDIKGDKWLGFSDHSQLGGGLGYLHTGIQDTIFFNFKPSAGGLQYDAVTTLESSGDTALWVGLFRGNGLDFLNHRGTPADTSDDEWLHCSGSTGLASDDVNAIFIDTAEYCWVGTTGGISRFSGTPNSPPANLGSAEGLSNLHVTDIVEDWEGNMWIATQSGLNFIFRENREKIYRSLGVAHGMADEVIYSLAIDPGDRCLWVGTECGLNRIRYEVTGKADMITLYPNPFVPGTDGHDRVRFLNISLPVNISIFNSSGERLLSYTAEHETEASWDGKTPAGKNVTAGIYFILLTLPNDETAVEKLAVIR